MAKKLGSHTITVVRQEKVDRYSDEQPVPVEHDESGCLIIPASYLEGGQGWVFTDRRQVFAPWGADVRTTDLVRFVDPLDSVERTWEVDGGIAPYENKRGRGKALGFYVKRLGAA